MVYHPTTVATYFATILSKNPKRNLKSIKCRKCVTIFWNDVITLNRSRSLPFKIIKLKKYYLPDKKQFLRYLQLIAN